MTDTPRRPNILFIMTDQQRFDAMSAHGGQARTPNLDRLGGEGADLRRFFTQSPVCVPSRCNIFSGRYPHSHRVRENHTRLDRHEPHLFKVLKQGGYRLGYVGKNHLLEGAEFANFDYVDTEETRRDVQPGSQREAYLKFKKAQGTKLRTVASWASAAWHDFDDAVTDTGMNGDSAIRFLREASTEEPFCLTVSFTDPHAPHIAPRRFEADYPLDAIRLHPTHEGDLDAKAPRFRIKQRVQGSLDATERDKRHYVAVYSAMVSFVDEQVGRILAALDEAGLREDTIVVFTADHGDFNFEHDMCKKDLVLLDCLLHVPCLVRWPGHVKVRAVEGTMVEQVDLYPTLLELCGLEVPFGCQGVSFRGLLEGTTDSHKDTVHAEICPPHFVNRYQTPDEFVADWQANHETPGHPLCWSAPFNVPGDFVKMIRTDRWKYIWFVDGFEELYDLQADPREWHNLAANPEHAATRDGLRLRLFEWCVRSEDPLDPKWHRQYLEQFDWQVAR